MNLAPFANPSALRLLACLALLSAACTTPTVGGPCDVFEIDGAPGQSCGQQLYFPSGLAISTANARLYVSNGNADLRYAGGSVQAIDLQAFGCAYRYAREGAWDTTSCGLDKPQWELLKCAMDFAASGTSGFGAIPEGCAGRAAALNTIFTDKNKARIGSSGLCRADLLDSAIIECDEQLLVAGALTHDGSPNQGSVRVGNFAGNMRLQPKVQSGTAGRLWLTVRGDPSITFIDVNAPTADNAGNELGCPADQEANPGLPNSCEGQQITVRDFHDSLHPPCTDSPDSTCVSIPAEPFGVAYDEGSYSSEGNGICHDSSPCDNANPCLVGACLTVGECKQVAGRGPDACREDTRCKDNPENPTMPLGSYCMKGVCENGARCASSDDCNNKGACRFARATAYQHVLVSHLLTGEVTLIDASVARPVSTPENMTSPEPVVLDVRGVGFSGDAAGRGGGFSLASRKPGDPRSLWYATSRTNPRLALFRVGFSNIILPFSLVPLIGPYNSGDDVRDIAFDSCDDRDPGGAGCRAFAIQNRPPSVFTIDTRIDPLRVPAGSPLNTISDVVSVCQGPSHLAFQAIADPLGGPTRNRVYVLCYGANQMAVVDPDLAALVDSVLVGRGPNEIVFNFRSGDRTVAEPRAFVTNFLDNSISVVDLQPGSRYENHVIARIGFTEPPRLQ